jgi:pimeloyl-ACP methyl ester carboxylesterase
MPESGCPCIETPRRSIPYSVMSHMRNTRTKILFPVLSAVLLAGGLAGLGGCTAYQAGSQDFTHAEYVAPIPEEDWPARETDELDRLAKETPQLVFRYVLDGTKAESELEPQFRESLKRADARIPYSRAFGKGIIRVVRGGGGRDRARTVPMERPESNGPMVGPTQPDPPAKPGSTDFLLRDFFSSVRFVSYTPLSERPADNRYESFLDVSSAAQNRYFKERSAGIRVNDKEKLMVLAEGTRLRLLEPPTGVKPRGMVVHIAGLGSIQFEEPLLNELLSRGWAVLRVATPRIWWYEETTYRMESWEDVEANAHKLAASFDDLLAETAYAAEAGLAWLAEERPDLPLSPLTIVGCSAGGLMTPAVVARMPERFDACVLVGAGGNLLKISQTSDLTDGGIKLAWKDGIPNLSFRERLFERYLELSKLDPLHTARFMRDKPTLFHCAEFDSTVPAGCCFDLYEELGRPDRLTSFVGHRLLFWTFPKHAKRIADWLDEAVERRLAALESELGGLAKQPTGQSDRLP